jgi:hypothetical protein
MKFVRLNEATQHEASHAVAAVAFGIDFSYVTVVPQPGVLGWLAFDRSIRINGRDLIPATRVTESGLRTGSFSHSLARQVMRITSAGNLTEGGS